MFTHIVVGSNDKAAAAKFYDALFAPLGAKQLAPGTDRLMYGTGPFAESPPFMVSTPRDGEPACHANGGTIGFAAPSPEAADAWHAAGLAAGGTACEDPPGVRDGGFGKLYLAYLRDPAGNKLCAMHRMPKD